MKVKLIGISRRNTEDKNGKKVVYSSLYYQEEFDAYTKENQECVGVRCGNVQTGLNTADFNVGDEINLDYVPTGYTKDGIQQYRLGSIDLIKPAAFKK